ncbi:MAG: signal peptidase II [Elusimicrobia bacterium]|nr:signal peptidase II [Elusimicrobiota bacterium]
MVLLIIFLLDRLTKSWASTVLIQKGSIPLLPFFHLTYVENTGAAFGVLRGQNLLFIFIALGLLTMLLFFRRQISGNSPWSKWGVLLVIGGALGNLYDRISLGYVIDFLDFRVWPVFNVADSCVSMGIALMALGTVRK